ncbi:Zn-dependent hydrolase [Alicyclobacillaceae bacterium I2511]|nr:Zn-dependent hydrolase [Alicyclobacillaceae bacterium I2511]
MVQADRLWKRLQELGDIGRDASGGVTRFSYSCDEWAAKERVRYWMQQAGLDTWEDAVGNLFGRREGTDAAAPAVWLGSHLDSVAHGGNFDGPLGVLAAIEVVQSMTEASVQTRHPIEVVVFEDEEGARFGFGMIGSRAVAGRLAPAELDRHRDAQGRSLGWAMQAYGMDPAQIDRAVRSSSEVFAYLELHIEQGRVLESQGLPIGIVSGIAGPLWLNFTFKGMSGHAGATPMTLRQDALAAAAEAMLVMEQVAQDVPGCVATVGKLTVQPGGVNIIPGVVSLTLDLRNAIESLRNQAEQRILEQVEKACLRRNVDVTVQTLQRIAPVECAPSLRGVLHQSCEELGVSGFDLVSGAGHDGMQLVDLCPVGMVFVPSREGISHQPEEWTSPVDCIMGTQVLYQAALHLAKEGIVQ